MKSQIHRLAGIVCSLALFAAMLPLTAAAEVPAAAQIGETTYPSLYKAMEAAETGATITLLADSGETLVVPAGKKVTLDLNGKKISADDHPVVVVNGGSLTVRDGTVAAEPAVSSDYKTVEYLSGALTTGSSTTVQVYGGGSFVLESGSVLSSGYCGVYAGAVGKGSGIVTIKGGYVHAREYAVGTVNDGTILNITGGVLMADANAAVAGNGTAGMGGTSINISGGTVIARNDRPGYIACGVYHPQGGTLTISGGTVVADGGVGVLLRGGSADISGGSIVATGTGEGLVGDSIVPVRHNGIAVDTRSGFAGLAADDKVTVGGNAVVTAEEPDVVAVSTNAPAGENGRVVVSGGTFSGDVTDFVIEGSRTIQDETGKWVLAPDEKEAVAIYNDQAYMTLREALMEAGSGPAAVRLTNSTTESVTIPAGANITLDLAENATLTGTGREPAILNNGTLTVTGKGTVLAAAYDKAAVENNGTANLRGGRFTRSVDPSGPNWYVLDNRGTMTLSDDVSVSAESPNASLIRNMGTAADKKATLNITGGTLTQNAFTAVRNDDNGVLNISGGTITSRDEAVQNWHEAAITGGTLNGPVRAWARTANPDMPSTLTISGSAVVNGDVRAVSYDGKAVPRITITGGTVNGSLGKDRYDSTGIQNLPADSPMAFFAVSGGTFRNPVPEAFGAENFHPHKNADGTYSVHTHQFGPWTTVTAPGSTTPGKEVQTCTVCGEQNARTLPATGAADPKATPKPKQEENRQKASATPKPASSPAPAAVSSPAPKSSSTGTARAVPQTSDDMPLGLLAGLAAAAAAAAVALLILRKRRMF